MTAAAVSSIQFSKRCGKVAVEVAGRASDGDEHERRPDQSPRVAAEARDPQLGRRQPRAPASSAARRRSSAGVMLPLWRGAPTPEAAPPLACRAATHSISARARRRPPRRRPHPDGSTTTRRPSASIRSARPREHFAVREATPRRRCRGATQSDSISASTPDAAASPPAAASAVSCSSSAAR